MTLDEVDRLLTEAQRSLEGQRSLEEHNQKEIASR
jgi:hypothetical protein